MTIEIRRARPTDLDAMLAISNRAAIETAANFAVEPETLESWRRDFEDTHTRMPWYVAHELHDAGALIGFAKASPWKGRCAYLHSAEVSVYVRTDRHRRGVGRALYDRLLATLRRQGYHALLAGITLPNDASVRLHESFGFRRVALLEQVGWKFERWHDVEYWELILGEGPPPDRHRSVDDVDPG